MSACTTIEQFHDCGACGFCGADVNTIVQASLGKRDITCDALGFKTPECQDKGCIYPFSEGGPCFRIHK